MKNQIFFKFSVPLLFAFSVGAKTVPTVANNNGVKPHSTALRPSGNWENSLVDLLVTNIKFNPDYPWLHILPYDNPGPAIAIRGRLLIAPIWYFPYATVVHAKKVNGKGKRYLARVIAKSFTNHAILFTVDDEEFWDDVEPVEVYNGVPSSGDQIFLVELPPEGGFRIEAGKVRETRLNVGLHNAEDVKGSYWPKFLSLNHDAAIGDSDALVLSADGQLLGIGVEDRIYNRGSRVLTSAVTSFSLRRFLRDVELHGGDYTVDSPRLGALWEKTIKNSAAQRLFYGAVGTNSTNLEGVLISHVDESWADRSRKDISKNEKNRIIGFNKHDVLLRLNGYDVGFDGTVQRGQLPESPYYLTKDAKQPLYLEWAIMSNFPGDWVDALVIREGKLVELQIQLSSLKRTVVPLDLHPNAPDYYVYGGLVFMSLPGRNHPPCYSKKFSKYRGVPKYKERGDDEQIIMLDKVLGTPLTVGLAFPYTQQLVSVNGVPVLNVRQLVEMVESSKDVEVKEFDEFLFNDGTLFIVNRSEAALLLPQMQETFQIKATSYVRR